MTIVWDDSGDDLLAERAWLVHLCRRFTGDPDAAEDLAQETLVDAWQHLQGQAAPPTRRAWLAGIARHRCLRWARRHRRDVARLIHVDAEPDAPLTLEISDASDGGALDLELGCDDLAALLDRALRLVPAQTRQVLVQRYIDEVPQAEVAARLGVSEGAVAVRVHRGKVALRRILERELGAEAAGPDPAWRETRIWCPLCGRHRLLGYLGETGTDFVTRCPGCCPGRDEYLTDSHLAGVFAGVTGYKPALTRLLHWLHRTYAPHLGAATMPCHGCGRPVVLCTTRPAAPLWLRDARGVSHSCPGCGSSSWDMLEAILLARPEGQRFWRMHPRIRALPQREIEAAGRPVLVAGFESLTDAARFEVVVARDTYAVVAAHGTPAA
jgi:RNA polymerase sigma-70 factor (ECF subfamily)